MLIIRQSVDSKAPLASITRPSSSAINKTITVTGTASDENITNWVLEYGSGESPTTWSRINSGTSSISNETLGIWNTSSLADGSIYTLRLRVIDVAGNTSQATVLVTKDSTEPTTVITSPTSNSFLNGVVAVKGTASDSRMESWTLEYGEGESPSSWTQINTGTASISDGILGWWDTSTLSNNSIYTLRLSATDKAGNTSQLNYQVTIDSLAPTVPTNLDCSYYTHTTIFLNWDESNDNTGVVQYRIYRDGIEIGSFNGTSYVDSGLASGNIYGYEIKAEDKAGNLSEASVRLNVTTLASSDTPPTMPASSYFFLSEDIVNLKWTASIDDDGIKGYEVLRDYCPIGFTTSTNYSDTTALHGKRSGNVLQL